MKSGVILGVEIDDNVRYCFGTPSGDGKLIKVMKCPKCGHSEEPRADSDNGSTPPLHGGSRGSNPRRSTKSNER